MGTQDDQKPAQAGPQPAELGTTLGAIERKLAKLAGPEPNADGGAGGSHAEPDEDDRRSRELRADPATLKASLVVAGLMRTPDCALDVYRDGRAADPKLDLSHLQRARELLDTIHLAITSADDSRWDQIEAAWRALREPERGDSAPPAVADDAATRPAMPVRRAVFAPAISAPAAVPPPAPLGPDDPLDRTEELTKLDAVPPAATPARRDPALPFKAPEDADLSKASASGAEGDGPEASTMRLRPHVLPFKKKLAPFDVPMPKDGSAPTEKLAVAHVAPPAPAPPAEPLEIDEEVTRADETTPLGHLSPLARPSSAAAQRTASWLPAPHAADIVRSPIQSLEGYASFTAEIQLQPGRLSDVRHRYGISDEASHQRLDAYWGGRFAREAGLLQAWEALHAQYRDRLLKRGG